MTVKEKTLWKNWADSLRQQMMGSLTPEVTRSVESIVAEVGTTKPESTWRSKRFWRACQIGSSPNDVFTTAGFEIDFQAVEDRHVEEITIRLNPTWMSILQDVVDRRPK